MTEGLKSKRYFRSLSDVDLVGGAGIRPIGVNAGRANREIRRRAARRSLDPFAWIRTVKEGRRNDG